MRKQIILQSTNGPNPSDAIEGIVKAADEYLYLGPPDSLTASAQQPETYQDEAYVNELKRRWKLTHGQDFGPEFFTRTIPKKYRDAL